MLLADSGSCSQCTRNWIVAVAGFGTAIAAVLADILTVALVTSVLALAGMVTLLAVKWRRDGLWLVQWHRPAAVAAPEPVQVIQWPHVTAEVISRRDVPARPAIRRGGDRNG